MQSLLVPGVDDINSLCTTPVDGFAVNAGDDVTGIGVGVVVGAAGFGATSPSNLWFRYKRYVPPSLKVFHRIYMKLRSLDVLIRHIFTKFIKYIIIMQKCTS